MGPPCFGNVATNKTKAVINIKVILNLVQDLPIGAFIFYIVVVVILESCSPGSVVTQKEENNGYWTETFQYDFLDNNELPKM